jgi:hypothetical protein
MPPTNGRFDWWRFWVHFAFGAVLGGLAGVYLWVRYWPHSPLGWLAIPAVGIPLGVVAGYFGEQYWESFRDRGWWNPLNWFHWW